MQQSKKENDIATAGFSDGLFSVLQGVGMTILPLKLNKTTKNLSCENSFPGRARRKPFGDACLYCVNFLKAVIATISIE